MKKKIIIISLIIILIISSFLLYCRFIGTKGFIVKEYLVKNEKIPNSFYGTKIVHISDIHYGRTVNEKKLKEIVEHINLIKPDIVVLTGDLMDRHINYQDKDIEVISTYLNSINASMGKYIITGNHDQVSDRYHELIEKINFTNLNDSYQILYNGDSESIMISGLSTVTNNIDTKEKLYDINTALKNEANNIKYNILILHEPDIIDDFEYNNFDLVLAGHSHGGQVRLPFVGAIIVPPYAKKYHDSHYDLGKSDLYISSGLGTSNLNLRLNNKPSFNLYRLVSK